MKVSEYYLPCLAVKLQTLAALYIVFDIFSAKVCSSAAKYLANISTKIYSLTFLSIHIMYEIKFIFIIVSFVIIKIVYTKYC